MFFRRHKTFWDQIHDVFDEYLLSLFPPYKKKDVLPVLVTLSIFTLVPLTAYATYRFAPRLLADNKLNLNVKSSKNEKEPLFNTNEILIKVAEQAKDKISEGHGSNSQIASLKNLKKDLGVDVLNVERVARIGKGSDISADIFRWYKITIEAEEKKALGKLERNLMRLDSTDPAAAKLQKVIDKFRADYDIENIELNYEITSAFVPNDPYYNSSGSWGQQFQDMWGMHQINSQSAWDRTSGSADVIIASVDTGVDRTHEDLKSNIWINSDENQNNGVDDDGNGYIDDYYGWDWYNNDSDPMDDHGHGSLTSSVASAVGNNSIGVVGLAFSSKIMPLKFMGQDGKGTVSAAAAALTYAADNGAKITTNSWSCYCSSLVLTEAAAYGHSKNLVMVVSAGNSNMDALDFSPACEDYAITVGASDVDDVKAQFSNWGSKLDVVAPGIDILSVKSSTNTICSQTNVVGEKYCRGSGTSLSAPHVAGLAALLLSKDSTLLNEQVRQIIRSTSVDLGAPGKDIEYGFGRIDAASAVNFARTKPVGPYISNPRSKSAISNSSVTIIGSVSGPSFQSYKLEIGLGRNPDVWSLITESSSAVVNGALASIDSRNYPNGSYTIRLIGYFDGQSVYEYSVYDIVLGSAQDPLPTTDIIGLPSPTQAPAPTEIQDIEPPSAPEGLFWENYLSEIDSRAGVRLQWGRSVDNVGVAGYRIYKNSNKIADIADELIYIDYDLRLGESYSYYATAYDSFGNESDKSNEIQVVATDKEHVVFFGSIYDFDSQMPKPNVEITFRQSKGGKLGSAISDSQGRYSFVTDQSGDVRLEIREPQYENQVITKSTTPGYIYEVNIPLKSVTSSGVKNQKTD